MRVIEQTFLCAVLLGVLADYNENPVIKLLQEYVQINSTTDSDLSPAVVFWKKLAENASVPVSVFEFTPGYPVVVIKWEGTNCSLTSVMLNSHMDVVPADEKDGWLYAPFSAHIDDSGDIYGRGTQDMKSLSILQFEVLRRLKSKEIPLLRDVYMTLMPDEETGGSKGMKQFVKSQQFADMNVGVQLDEGFALTAPSTIAVFANEKAVWRFRVDCYGTAAHGSLLLPVDATAVGKCLNVTNELYKFRNEQYKIAKAGNNAGDYTSVNLNKLFGGSAINVIPGHVAFEFDVRLATGVDEKLFNTQLEQWTSNAGGNVTLTFIVKDHQTPETITDDSSPYWRALIESARMMNITLKPMTTTGSTDGKYLRSLGIPCFGLSPITNTPSLAHKVNERLNKAVFLKGLDIYEEIVRNVANIPGDQVSHNSSEYLKYY